MRSPVGGSAISCTCDRTVASIRGNENEGNSSESNRRRGCGFCICLVGRLAEAQELRRIIWGRAFSCPRDSGSDCYERGQSIREYGGAIDGSWSARLFPLRMRGGAAADSPPHARSVHGRSGDYRVVWLCLWSLVRCA